jgi:transmembrane sensor
MDLSQATDLIKKYREGKLTEDETALLESWYLELGKSRRETISTEELERHLDAAWDALPVHDKPEISPFVKIRPLLKWFTVAASILIIGTLGVFLNNTKKEVAAVEEEQQFGGDATPGENKAILMLANGGEIMLDTMKNGELAREGGTSIVKTNTGEVVYMSTVVNSNEAEVVKFNTIMTPKAGQYQITLPDGTKAWLNAASSIRFPTKFVGKDRVVEIMGEVYFEVAKVMKANRRVPFKVVAGKQLVEVLGTHFNINSYKDEGLIKTTLVEGSIKVNMVGNSGKEILLRPGQQAQFVAVGDKTLSGDFNVKEIDAGSVIAWKDGYFRFDHVGLPELMRQLSRWYDMEVVYNVPVGEHEFVGEIERSSKLSKVLKILEMGDVHFKIEGKKIIVTD